ncbi:ABC transporter ATP-binding protein [Gallicola sp. Sow4_E12]|uniref:ABC transporter ATP-binding protein n=1 Tax=Gallicola sp. Sow4_E12 TaxID=3438785 RepID=UPI003F921400
MLLKMENVTKSFFNKKALDNVDFELREGEIHALLGENGAGKTTLMNILYGIYQKDSGKIQYRGNSIEFKSPKDALDNEIGMVQQHFSLVDNLTVSQNITLGLKEKGFPFVNRKELDHKISGISKRYGLGIYPKEFISELSVGEQQRVEILKLLYRNVRLLILDEPTAVLTPHETKNLYSILKQLKREGHSIIIITHKVSEIMEISDRITILRDGEWIASLERGQFTEVDLSNYMIGRPLKTEFNRQPLNDYEVGGLELKNISLKMKDQYKLERINIKIKPGTIHGIAGVDGNGQKELAEVILGIHRHTEGMILYDDEDFSDYKVRDRKARGFGYIPADRHHDGLLMNMSLWENYLLNEYENKEFRKHGLLDKKIIYSKTKGVIEKFNIKAPGIESRICYLSGGNQQKMILARELKESQKVIVASQPTRGLDMGAAEFVHEQLMQCRNNGGCIIMISTDMEEIIKVCDKISVLYKGKIMGTVVNSESLDISEIGLMMAGIHAKRRGENDYV